MLSNIIRLGICLICCLPLMAYAADPNQFVKPHTFEFSVATGFGRIANPIKSKEDVPLWLLPNVNYYGKRFYLSNTNLGYTLFENEYAFIDLYSKADDFGLYYLDNAEFVALSLGQVNSPRGAPQVEPITLKRSIAYLAGAKAGLNFDDSHTFSMEALYDVTNVHNGYHLRFSYQKSMVSRYGNLNVNAGFDYLSAKQNEYYFYFTADEITQSGLLKSEPLQHRATWVPSIKLEYQYPLSDIISLISFYQYQKLNNNAFDAQLVQNRHIQSFFVGINWKLYEG